MIFGVKRAVLFAGLILLAGCNTASGYDIDVECWNDPSTATFQTLEVDDTLILICWAPTYFRLQCKSETVQRMDDTYSCTAHDGEKVRVKKVTPPEAMMK